MRKKERHGRGWEDNVSDNGDGNEEEGEDGEKEERGAKERQKMGGRVWTGLDK